MSQGYTRNDMSLKIFLFCTLQFSSHLALEPSYFEDLSFASLGKRAILRSLYDNSVINCVQRCKRDLDCFDIAFQKKSSNNGLCILLTKLKQAKCIQTKDGKFVIQGDHTGPYNIERLCKTKVIPDNVQIVEAKYFDPQDYDDEHIPFVVKKKRPQFGNYIINCLIFKLKINKMNNT